MSKGARVLDVGCGTGYFTRQLARDGYDVVGIDNDPAMLEVANAQRVSNERYIHADAGALPFENGEFDCAIAITALCFVPKQARALAEMRRVSKNRVLLGVLNRHSWLYLQKGRGGGKGAYYGAHWHDLSEFYLLFSRAGMRPDDVASAVYFPAGGVFSRCMEKVIPRQLPLGALLFATAEVRDFHPR
ncbi:MAG: class I SAM-dependent methyltransferase [Gammaproteobacteria bacterium]|nr:class I SAM-dependent methyltransferase [Gammaproteobacteria bacterium]